MSLDKPDWHLSRKKVVMFDDDESRKIVPFPRRRRSPPVTRKMADHIRWLYRHQDRVVTRAELLEQVFGQRGDLQTRAVDMAIAVLRKKLETDPARPTLIVSIKGAGYAWRLAR